MSGDNNQKDMSALDQFFADYGSALAFIGGAAFVFGILQIVYFQFYVGTSAFNAYLRFCAGLSTDLLNLIGEEIQLINRTLKSPDGSYVTVVEGCDALRIHSVLVAAIVAYQASWRQKAVGVMVGVSIMFVLNIVRISMLLWLEIHVTELFDIFHHTVLPLGLWASAMLCFYCWGRSVEVAAESA